MRSPRYFGLKLHDLGRMVHRLPTDMTLEQQAAELRRLFKVFCPDDEAIGLNAASSASHSGRGQRRHSK
mgnify:CR=1 FL=1